MTKDHLKEVIELFQSGFHCSQAVLVSFSEEHGVSKETALKISSSFGGGIAGFGRTCGALTGALMVVGLKYGTTNPTDLEAKKIIREKSRALIDLFEKKHDSSQCNDLVGFDRSQMSGAELMAKLPHFHSVCPKYLETVITYLEEEL